MKNDDSHQNGTSCFFSTWCDRCDVIIKKHSSISPQDLNRWNRCGWCFSNHTNLLHVWMWVDGSGGESEGAHGRRCVEQLHVCVCAVLGDTVELLISVNSFLILLGFSSCHWLPPSQSCRTSRADITETLLLWQTAPFLCNARNFAMKCLSSRHGCPKRGIWSGVHIMLCEG